MRLIGCTSFVGTATTTVASWGSRFSALCVLDLGRFHGGGFRGKVRRRTRKKKKHNENKTDQHSPVQALRFPDILFIVWFRIDVQASLQQLVPRPVGLFSVFIRSVWQRNALQRLHNQSNKNKSTPNQAVHRGVSQDHKMQTHTHTHTHKATP